MISVISVISVISMISMISMISRARHEIMENAGDPPP